MQNSSESTYVNCPHCNREVLWHQKSESRPFCSERCRLIDLGEWIEEKNKIPTSIEENFTPY